MAHRNVGVTAWVRPSLKLVHIALAMMVSASLASCHKDPGDPDRITLDLSPEAGTATADTPVSFVATALSSSGPPQITFSATQPAGITVAFATPTIGALKDGLYPTTTTATVHVAGSVAPGVYDIAVFASEGVDHAVATFKLTVVALPDFSMTATPAVVPMQQGTIGSTAIGILPLTGFSSTVDLSISGLPAGLSASFNPVTAHLSGGSILSFIASPSLAPGSYPLEITGNSFGLTHTLDIAVNITVPPGFTLSTSPSGNTVTQGSSVTYTVFVNRLGDFTGPVTLSATGLPNGVSASFVPAIATGASSVMTIFALSNAAIGGPVPITISGASGTLGAQTTGQLTVQGSFNTTFDFSGCTSTGTIPWVAFQNGSGTWTPLTSTNNFYHANVTAATGSMAYVYSSGGFFTTTVLNYSQSELTAGDIVLCPSALSGSNTMTGIATGLAPFEQAFVGFGGALSSATSTNANLSFSNVFSGTQDVVGYKSDVSNIGLNNRGVLIRGIPVIGGGSVGTVDFGGVNSFVPVGVPATVPVAGDETLSATMGYYTGPSCTGGLIWIASSIPGPFTVFGVPAAKQLPTDWHALTLTASNALTTRITLSFSNVPTGLSLTLPTAPAGVSVTATPGAPYKRENAVMNAPADIPSAEATLRFADVGAAHTFLVVESAGFRGGATTFALNTPDFTGVGGWTNGWAPSASVSTPWNITTTQSAGSFVRCTQGASMKTTRIFGVN